MVTNIFCVIPQNAGTSTPYLDGTEELEVPFIYNFGEPSPSSTRKSYLADSPWPMFRQNLDHTGLSPYDTSSNNGQLKWSFTANWYVDSSPAIASDGTIYIGSHDKKLYAINSDGSEKWNFTTEGSIKQSSPAIDVDGTIYIGSFDSKLYAINPDGSQKWNFTTGGAVRSSPAIGSDGTIYVGSLDHKLYAINPDGTQKWNFITNGGIRSSPAISSDGTIYIGSRDRKLYAINQNGTEKWSYATPGYVISSPAIDFNGTIYVGSTQPNPTFHAINPDGTRKWSFDTGSGVLSSPAIGSAGTIYFGAHPCIYAINHDGSQKWKFMTGNTVHSSPAIGSDGTIYIGSQDDKVYAINPDGSEKWNFTTNNAVVYSSPAIGPDGTIYIGSRDYKFYAIGTPSTPPTANAGPDQTVNEGDAVSFDASTSYDPDGSIKTYEWDFDSSDGLWWETGATPDATSPNPTYIYGDDGIYVATLSVTDNDNLSATDICNITVQNVNPTVIIESAIMDAAIGLRVAGRKFNNVSMSLYEEGNSIGYVSIERLPGSPNEQMVWIPVLLDLTKTYSATVTYTPEDPPNVGANPVWIYIKSQNGSIKKIHHTFNVQQSKKKDSDHWNHIDPWEVDLSGHFIGLLFKITSHITDPGSDDETLIYAYGSQTITVTYLNNPPNQDPYPSPEVNPRDIMDTITLVYEGPGTITLVVKNDDNIRLGAGQGSDSIGVA
jgi:outer membrane protein assembly factor BamB